MTEQSAYASDYAPKHLSLVRSTCLTVATFLGYLLDEVVIIGGLVPGLLIPQERLPNGTDQHVGTRDLDMGFSLGLLEGSLYQEIAQQLTTAGFKPDVNEGGNEILQRWVQSKDLEVSIEFLIPKVNPGDRGGAIFKLEHNFGAIICPGLQLAFQDRKSITLSGQTLLGANATRNVGVCGPGAYIVLKALAFADRGKYKDAYDLYYVVRNFDKGPEDVAAHLLPLLSDDDGTQAIEILRRDFTDPGGVGPRRVAEFLYRRTDGNTQADVAGFISQLLSYCGD
jgi:hypothetical protein